MEPTEQFSQELLLYPAFYRTTVQRKMLDFNRLWDKDAIKELPRSCVLHLLDDNFNLVKPIVFVPEDDNWLLNKLPSLKFINHVTQPVAGVIPFKESFMLPQKGIVPTLINYRKKTLSWMRPWKDITKMPPIVNSQAVISYNSLYRARIFGQLKATRRFNYIFTSVLNSICKLPNNMHFIPIPVGNTEYERSEFILSFKGYTKASIRHPNDPWYQLLMHLYGFMHTGTESLFSKLPPSILKNIHLVFYSFRNILVVNLQNLLDFNQGTKDVVLKRFIKQMNTLAQQGQALSMTDYGDVSPAMIDIPVSSSITEKDINDDSIDTIILKAAPDKGIEKKPITLTSTINDEEVVERPKPVEQSAIDRGKVYRFSRMSVIPFYSKVSEKLKRFLSDYDVYSIFDSSMNEHQIMYEKIKKIKELLAAKPEATIPESRKALPTVDAKVVPIHAAKPQVIEKPEEENTGVKLVEATDAELIGQDIPDTEAVDPKILEIKPKLINNGQSLINAPAYTTSPSDKSKTDFNKTTTKEIDWAAAKTITSHAELTKAQIEHAVKLSDVYKTLKYDDQTLEEILNSSPDDTISKNELDFLKGQIPDPSMLKSSVANFDTEYMDKFFKKDMVAVLASFNKVGMFLKDLSFKDISDAMNNMIEIKAVYEDLNHKTHTVRFTVPKVDSRGYCYINGGTKVLKKQRITNPICKVSPVRVTLASDYNKYLVQRSTTVAHSFINYIDKIIESSDGNIKAVFGTAKLPYQTYPYEYTAIAKKYTALFMQGGTINDKWWFYFNNPEGIVEYFKNVGVSEEMISDALDTEDDIKGYLIGINPASEIYVYMKLDSSICLYHSGDGVYRSDITLIDLLCEVCNLEISHLSEWTEFKLLSKSVPTIFALAYKYGLSYMLNYTKCNYAIYDKNVRYPRRQSDVIIKFKDKVLVIPRAPLCYSLLFAGLNNYDLTKINIEELDFKDVYYDLLQSKKMSVHNLKGIDNFFDLFVDPITRDVLFRMGEPTEAKDLLIRATALLATEDCPPVAACTNYRFRSYERIAAATYKVLANTYSTFRYKGINTSSTFSIRDFEITNMVINDQLMEPVDQINPINDIKYREEYGHGGSGGRQSTDTFMVDDRKWPDDGVGIIGESSVDNGKTGYVGNMSNNPTIDNIRGLTYNKKVEDVEPSEAFTCSTLLGPCVLQDDSKRLSFLNIHLSHYVPTKEMSLPRVRTGYERVVAHRSKPPFVYSAEADGIIEKIDTDAHMIIVSYPEQNKKISVEYGDLFTNNGGGGFYCTQNIAINNFNEGDKVKRGDVIVYNDRFFKPDPFNKQVDMSFGVLANVALLDNCVTVEDSDIISKDLADKLDFNPVHVRDIVLTKTTNIHKYAAVGTNVINTDPLIIFDQSIITDDMFGGSLTEEDVELFGSINRQTPRAKFTGRICKIDVFYLGDTSNMSTSVKNLVNYINKEKKHKANIAKNSENSSSYPSSTEITQSTRIGTTVLDEDTVIFRFMIQCDTAMASGDKVEFDSSLKSVCAGVDETGWMSEDGSVKCDALFSQKGQLARLINSPVLVGLSNRILEKIEKDALDMYFNN